MSAVKEASERKPLSPAVVKLMALRDQANWLKRQSLFDEKGVRREDIEKQVVAWFANMAVLDGSGELTEQVHADLFGTIESWMRDAYPDL